MENLNENLNENPHDNLDDMPEVRNEPKYEWVNTKKGWQFVSVIVAAILVFSILAILKAGEYGFTLFLTIPFSLALVLSFQEGPKSSGKTLKAWGKAISIITAISIILLVLGLEGVICILMAIGLIILPTFLGCLLGYGLSRAFQERKLSVLLMVFIINPSALTYDVYDTTKIESVAQISTVVNASVSDVWQILTQKVEFNESSNFFLKSGVSYPLDMEIIQKDSAKFLSCNTNNGKTFFKIDSLIQNQKLQFSATQEILPMRELTMYHDLEAAHLHGYFESDYGTFEIQPINEKQCLLIAKTQYNYAITPAFYWKWWSDYLLNTMHENVLSKVKEIAEKND
jgi:hypothetical protein